jgi:hypothetical protein
MLMQRSQKQNLPLLLLGRCDVAMVVASEFFDTRFIRSFRYNNNNNNNNNSNNNTKTLDRFTTKDSYTWNITHNTESTAV